MDMVGKWMNKSLGRRLRYQCPLKLYEVSATLKQNFNVTIMNPRDSKDSINYTITIVIVPLERKPDASQSTLIASSHTQVGQHDLA